ncbi:hypothetical protein ARAF_0651 [Arsenophonus endosymbiont of Aleurodicus floccissimus]|nr:hypothetical protein ARAF_0651 [Arsenophonus endosymbiont of Aleurodicus floccissimus]
MTFLPSLDLKLIIKKKITEDIFTSFLFLSNHIDAIIIPEEDRRIAVFGGPDHLQDVKYYETLYRYLFYKTLISYHRYFGT